MRTYAWGSEESREFPQWSSQKCCGFSTALMAKILSNRLNLSKSYILQPRHTQPRATQCDSRTRRSHNLFIFYTLLQVRLGLA